MQHATLSVHATSMSNNKRGNMVDKSFLLRAGLIIDYDIWFILVALLSLTQMFTRAHLQRLTKRLVPGCENFVLALA